MFRAKNELKRRATRGVCRAIGPLLSLPMAVLLLGMSQATSASLADPDPGVTPTPEAVVTPAFNKLEGWKVYTDPDYGYSVRYPRVDWDVQIALENVGKPEYVIRRRTTLSGPEHAVINIDVWDNVSRPDLMKWFGQHQRPFFSEEAQVPPEPNAKVAGVPALFVVQPEYLQAPARASTVLQKDLKAFRIDYIASDGGLSQGIYRGVLSTFEFDPAQETDDVLPSAPFLWVSDAQPLGDQDCCGYHDPQYNPYLCYSGNCTWWGAYKRSDVPYLNQSWGNAEDWTRRAAEEGFAVNNTPATGALGGTPRSGYVRPGWQNHVAYVESFDGSKIQFSDMDYGQWNCSVDHWYQYDWSGIEFIHSRDGATPTPTPPSPAPTDTPTPGPGDGIEVCDGTYYGPPCQLFAEGEYVDLREYGWYDRIESVRFKGSYVGNYHVVLNTEIDFGGTPYHADSDVPDLGPAHRNRIRSMHIYRHQPPVTDTPTPAESVTVDTVGVEYGDPQTTFYPGDKINLVIGATNHTGSTVSTLWSWDTYDSSWQKVAALSFDDWERDMLPGWERWAIRWTIPADLPGGTYTFVGSVACGAEVDWESTAFEVVAYRSRAYLPLVLKE